MQALRLIGRWRARCARWWQGGPPHDLRALAREVEREQPVLAAELRGIALHWEALQRSAR